MKTIRQLAQEHGCTVQNIYNHINANKEALQGHIEKHGKKNFLDDYACELISGLITPKETVIVQDQELINQINELRAALFSQNQETTRLVNELAAEKTKNAELNSKQMLLEERTARIDQENKKLQDSNNSLQNELKSYKRTWFGFYRKKL